MMKMLKVFLLLLLTMPFSQDRLYAQIGDFDRVYLRSSMDQLRFEVPGENRYWIMSKTGGSQNKAFALYSPDDGYWWTYWKEGTGDMIIKRGRVGIGTTAPTSRLTVNGTAKAEEVIITEDIGADFVFEDNYPLTNLSEVEQYIKNNKHLPEIPPAKEMVEKGVKVGALQMKLLQKIEELTLHLIEKEKKMEKLKEQFSVQQKQIEQLKRQIKEK